MTLGVVMLVHTGLARAAQMVRHWTNAGCPVVIHVDRQVDAQAHALFVQSLAQHARVHFAPRRKCEWGTWGVVAATRDAATLLLDRYPDVQHVYLASGACLPLRPVSELRGFLQVHTDTDFIESVRLGGARWTVSGLEEERFYLRFPFSWKHRKKMFNRSVRLQRAIGYRRRKPAGLTFHMGSQWWCLTRRTLNAIHSDPARKTYDRFFRHVWIPDESYYQTLARRHAHKLHSQSLTLSKFDAQGKPYMFYDDHLPVLQRTDYFVARKIWRHADLIYQSFPRATAGQKDRTAFSGMAHHVFPGPAHPRHGLYMAGRYPAGLHAGPATAAPYRVFVGFDDVIPDFRAWLTRQTGATVHGHLFARAHAEFADDSDLYQGCLSRNARLRDSNARMFLANLLWTGRGAEQCFQFGPNDRQEISTFLTQDSHAHIHVISDAWTVPLFLSGRSMRDKYRLAFALQRNAHRFITRLQSADARAHVTITPLAAFIDAPMGVLQTLIRDPAGRADQSVTEMPEIVSLDGLHLFLQALKNHGLHSFLTGDIAASAMAVASPRKPQMITTR